MTLVDTHCHLQVSAFDGDREAVWARARAARVEKAVCCATEPGDWDAVATAAQTLTGVVPAYGVHPWYIPSASDWFDELRRRLTADAVAWVGEIGLDRTVGPELAVQEAVFVPQLALADELGRPVSVHCRRTWDRLIPILRRHPGRVVLHSFSGSVPVARQLLDRGLCWFSFSGALTRPRSRRAVDVLGYLPRDRVVIETDAPDLTPSPVLAGAPGARNEPAHLVHTLRAVAEIWGVGVEDAAAQFEKNVEALGPAGGRA